MTFFVHSLKRLMRNKVNLLFILVIPALMIGFIYGFADRGGGALTVGVMDHDNTPFTHMLTENLEERSPVIMLKEESDIRGALTGGRVDYVLTIDAGFTSDLLAGSEQNIRGYSIQETNVAMPVKLNVENFLSVARNLALATGGDREAFYRGMDYYLTGNFSLETNPLEEVGGNTDGALGSMGLLALNMLFLATFATNTLLKDRENRTFFRVLASPLSIKSYMLQSILSFLLVSLVQVAGVFLVLQFIFRMYLGPSPLSLYGVMAVFALLSVAFGVALSGVTQNIRQAGTAATLLIMPMSMLGGLFWPRDMMPLLLQRVSQMMPTSWMMDAAYKVVQGNPLSSVGGEILVMLLFTLAFFLLGSWRSAEIAR